MWVLKLERGDEVITDLTEFCARQGIQAATFHGIGAVENFDIGYYDLGKKEYFFRHEPRIHEVASMNGNVALVDGKPFIHAHAVLSATDETCATVGGHIKRATVAVTLEVFLTPLPTSLSRSLDDAIGLKLLDL